jgi:hypothetical protein
VEQSTAKRAQRRENSFAAATCKRSRQHVEDARAGRHGQQGGSGKEQQE